MIPVRMLYVAGKPFLSLEDLKTRLKDDQAILDAAAVAKVGYEAHREDGAVEIMRRAIASFIMAAAGESSGEGA